MENSTLWDRPSGSIDTEKLTGIPLSGLTAEEAEELNKVRLVLEFGRGETIIKQGSQPTHVVWLEQGSVKFLHSTAPTRNMILDVLSGSGLIGSSHLTGYPLNRLSIIALDHCVASLYDTGVFYRLLKQNGTASLVYLEMVSDFSQRTMSNFFSLALKQKEGRIADVLLSLSLRVYRSPSFRLTLTRKELAYVAGCSCENLIMTLSRWQREGIIQCQGKHLQINDMGKLKTICKNG
jgi:CRP/FNR family transcriptional regulator, polysaccharide utilization system transcription regulator